MLSHLFNNALRSPAKKGLTFWLSFVMFNCFLSFSHVVSLVIGWLVGFVALRPKSTARSLRDGQFT